MARNETPHGANDGVAVSKQGEAVPVGVKTHHNQQPTKVKNMETIGKDMTTCPADEILSEVNAWKEETGATQTHGNRGSNIANINGCITLKRRKGATHYAGVFVVEDMEAGKTRNTVQVRNAVRNSRMKYAVHCFAHGTQKPVPSRGAGMASVRLAGKAYDGNTPMKKGAVQQWCGRCVKDWESQQQA